MIDFIKDLWHQPVFACFLSVMACLCFYFLKNGNTIPKKYIWVVYCSILIITSTIFFGKLIERIYHAEVWDFTVFYLYGKVAVSGHNFYSPESFHAVFNTLQLPPFDYKEFTEEVVGVGFLYPPPTALLFSPLGFFSYHTAFIIWTIFTLSFIPGCIYLIYDQYFRPYKLNGLMLITILFFLSSPVRSTVVFSQTNFILLFLLLLMKKYSDKNFAGIFLALAFFTKPYMIVFAVIFLVRKQWKTLGYFAVTSFLLTGLTALLFGIQPFISYIVDNPSKRLPAWVFEENINQSLHAVLLRAHLISIDKPALYTLILGGGLLLTAAYLFYLVKRKLYDYVWVVLLLVGLIFYPGTLSYYAVLLLFIIFQFFDENKKLGFGMFLNIGIIAIFAYLSTVSVFTCICFLLALVVLKSLYNPNVKEINTY